MKTWGEGSHLQAKGSGLRNDQAYWYFRLRLPDSITVTKQVSIIEAAQPVEFAMEALLR